MTTEQSIPNITPEEETWGNELEEMIKYLEDYQECPLKFRRPITLKGVTL
jgi:hypothetical protein